MQCFPFCLSCAVNIMTSKVKFTFIRILLRQASHYHQMTNHVTDGCSDPSDRGDSVTAARLVTLAWQRDNSWQGLVVMYVMCRAWQVQLTWFMSLRLSISFVLMKTLLIVQKSSFLIGWVIKLQIVNNTLMHSQSVLSIEDVFLSERKYAEDYARSAINYIAAPEKSLRVRPRLTGHRPSRRNQIIVSGLR